MVLYSQRLQLPYNEHVGWLEIIYYLQYKKRYKERNFHDVSTFVSGYKGEDSWEAYHKLIVLASQWDDTIRRAEQVVNFDQSPV